MSSRKHKEVHLTYFKLRTSEGVTENIHRHFKCRPSKAYTRIQSFFQTGVSALCDPKHEAPTAHSTCTHNTHM